MITFVAEARKNVWALLGGGGGSNITVRLYINNVAIVDGLTLSFIQEASSVPGYAPQRSSGWSAPGLSGGGDGQIVSPNFVFTRGAGSPGAAAYGYYLTVDIPQDGQQVLQVNGTDAFTLTLAARSTGSLAAGSTAADVRAALQALSNLPNLGNVTVTGTGTSLDPFLIGMPSNLAIGYGSISGSGVGLVSITPYAPLGPPAVALLGIEAFPTPYPYTLPTDRVPIPAIQLADRNLTA